MELPQSRLVGTGHWWDPCLRRRPADPAGGGAATVHSPENDTARVWLWRDRWQPLLRSKSEGRSRSSRGGGGALEGVTSDDLRDLDGATSGSFMMYRHR